MYPKLCFIGYTKKLFIKAAYMDILICHNVCQNHDRGKLEDCVIRRVSNVHLWKEEKVILLGTDGW